MIEGSLGRCGTCRFWHRRGQVVGLDADGECRRRAPVAVPVQGARGLGALAVWPPVKAGEVGCGEWEAERKAA